MERLHWEFGPLVMRDGVCFGYGWLFHENLKTRDLRLVAACGECEIRVGIAKFRDNVKAHYPQHANALNSGFTLLGSCGAGRMSTEQLCYRATFEDGSAIDLPVPQNQIQSYSSGNSVRRRITSGRIAGFLKRNLYLLKNLQFDEVLGKMRRYLDSRPTSFLAHAEAVCALMDEIERRDVVLVIDHDLGGGANNYRESMIANLVDAGRTVLIFSCHLETLSPVLIVRNRNRDERYAIPGQSLLRDLAGWIDITEVIYNTGVSLPHPEELAPLLICLRQDHDARITLLVHDYFMICPSHNLLNETGRYCGVPDIGRCLACLPANQQDFSSLFVMRDIVLWRKLWEDVIVHADEIRFFSEVSRDLFSRAYTIPDMARTAVIPHVSQRMAHGRVVPAYSSQLRIGIVGNIGHHKGAGVVQQLAREIVARGLDTRIAVIGTVEAQCDTNVVSQTGPYRNEDLAALIEESGANVMLFPSIWPETFSYVVQELMELELPVACYDVGAPAARVAEYDKGLVMKETSAGATLNELIMFHRKIYFSG